MRAARTKAIPVKVLREETGVSTVPNVPQQNLKAAVVVDAMYLVVAGPSTKTKSSGLSQSATETICRLHTFMLRLKPEDFRATP